MRPLPRLEGFALDHARNVFQQAIARSGAYMEDEIARQEALSFQLGRDNQKRADASGYRDDELARQKMLRVNLAGYQEDEVLRQGAMLAGSVDKQEFWLAVIDHLNQALPYVSNIVTNIAGARERVETMRLQIQKMESAGQQEYVMLEARNYWLAQIAKQQGVNIDPNTYQNAMVFGDALKSMGPQGQAYLNQGYNQAFNLGAEFGQGGEIKNGYMNLTREDWAKVQAGKNLPYWILGITGGVLVLGAGVVTTVVLVTRSR